jgi:uncharacterized membrane protein
MDGKWVALLSSQNDRSGQRAPTESSRSPVKWVGAAVLALPLPLLPEGMNGFTSGPIHLCVQPDLSQPSLLPTGDHPRKHRTWFERARTVFLAGLLVVVPALIAVYAVLILMRVTEGFFGDFIEQFIIQILGLERGEPLPVWAPIAKSVASFILAVTLIMLAGWLSTFLLVQRLIRLGEALITRLPLVKFFYNVPKEVLNTFAVQRSSSFKRVVLIEYPRKNAWALGFATGELKLRPSGIPLVAVFVPTTPNPTSGFLLYFKPEEVFDVNLTLEEGARLIISGGILSPESLHTQVFRGLEQQPDLPPLEMPKPSEEPLRS